MDITLKLAGAVKSVRDERAGKALPDGDTFRLAWTMNEAVVVSFEGAPPRPGR